MNTFTGQTAIPFELLDTDDQTHRLKDYEGKWLLMIFHRHLG